MPNKVRARLHARIALAVLVLAALAPSISRCLAFASPASYWLAATCSVSALPGTPPTPAAPQAMGLDCPMCVVQALPGLLPRHDLAAAWFILKLGQALPSPALPVPRVVAVRTHAQPRAPPALA